MAHTFLIMVTYTYTICGFRIYVHNGLHPSRFSLLQRHSIFVWSTNCNKYIKCNQNTLVKISWALGENSFFLPPLEKWSCLSNRVNQKFNLIYILMKIKGPYEMYIADIIWQFILYKVYWESLLDVKRCPFFKLKWHVLGNGWIDKIRMMMHSGGVVNKK